VGETSSKETIQHECQIMQKQYIKSQMLRYTGEACPPAKCCSDVRYAMNSHTTRTGVGKFKAELIQGQTLAVTG